MNEVLLKSIMVLHKDTQEALADALGLSLSRLNAKIKERDGASFTQPEMAQIIQRYSMNQDQAMAVFFS